MKHNESMDKVTQADLRRARGDYNTFKDKVDAMDQERAENASQLSDIATEVDGNLSGANFTEQFINELNGGTIPPNSTITPVKTTFFDLDIASESEQITGQIVGNTTFVADANAVTIFLPISDFIFYRVKNMKGYYTGSLYLHNVFICDASKNRLQNASIKLSSGNTSTMLGNVEITNKTSNKPVGATYFAVSFESGENIEIDRYYPDAINASIVSGSKLPTGDDFIINADNLVTGTEHFYFNTGTGNWEIGGDRNSTNVFEVSDGDTLYTNGSYVYVEYINSDGERIAKSGVFNSTTPLTVSNVDVVYGIAYTQDAYYIDDLWIAKSDLSYISSFREPKVINGKYVDKRLPLKYIETWLKDKKVHYEGDSISDGGTGGEYISYIESYLQINESNIDAVGGSTVSTVGTNTFTSDARVNEFPLDAVCGFIVGGTNDANINVPIGTIDMSNDDTDTLCGAYNVLLSKIAYKYYKTTGYYGSVTYTNITQVDTSVPFKLFIATPPPVLDVTLNEKIKTVSEAIKEIASMWSIPVIDVFGECNVNILSGEYYRRTQADNVHLNALAHERYADVYVGIVRSLNKNTYT